MTQTQIVVAVVVLFVLFMLIRSRGKSSPRIDVDTATEEDIRTLLMTGHKIDAIKVYRRLHRVDLKTAKDAVERLADQLPRSTGG